jgi:outer membrane immunogenic protein
MSKLVVAGAALAALIAGPALAADMPVKGLAYKPGPYSWTGCYAGFNAGVAYARATDTWTPNPAGFGAVGVSDIFPTANGTLRPGGATAGGQLGCNYQTGVTVWGLETDFNYTDNKATLGASTSAFGAPITETVTSKWLGTTRARVGFSNPGYNSFGNWMVFATGGVAYANVQFTDLIFFPPTGTTNAGSSNDTKAGWTAGGGFEWAALGNWTVKFEALYADLGKVSYTSFNSSPAFPLATIVHDHHFTETVVRFGANYRFGYGAVVAGY